MNSNSVHVHSCAPHFEHSGGLAGRFENDHLGGRLGNKSEKTAQNGTKTGYFAGIRPHCYIMATMGSKLSVYVNINATERLFFEQKNLREALQASRESGAQPASRTLVSATESFSC
ncbi:hypothetical protein NKJ41_17445 [Mesorhizobium sp. M0146]|uniref:hypothetical protein n=1 Tax=Mesorhizobium sp. M0146 TaxID=2956896 RepID=UPI0033386BBC